MAGGLVRSRSGMGNSLWRTSSAGLRLPVSRMKLPFYGLVFYAPLWHPNLSGTTFYDLAGQNLCTSTGTTWGYKGRTFAPTTSKITVPFNTNFNLGATATFLFWVNVTAFPAAGSPHYGLVYVLTKAPDTTHGFAIYLEATAITLLAYGKADTTATKACTINTGQDYFFGISDNAGTVTFVQDDTNLGTDTKTSGYVDTAASLWLGQSEVVAGQSVMNGVEGEIAIFNKALSVADMIRYQQTTKWRFS